ncbi:MAG: hypothetical protein H6Q12_1444, partial [Bacteroidetes bacterium]|nr:hypothetical protein [Bacteroidota bacterium]
LAFSNKLLISSTSQGEPENTSINEILVVFIDKNIIDYLANI